jgi:hypothetical protein
MKLNHYKQWKTTTLGLIIIAATITSVFVKEIQWSDAIIGLAAGLMLVFSPDTILDRIGRLLKVLVLFVFTGCMSEKKLAQVCADKFPIKDSTVIIERVDTTYQYIKGDSIRVPFYLKGKVVYKDTICPPVRVPQVTKTKEKIVYQENTAKLAIKDNIIYNLNKSVHEHLKKIDELKKSNESLIKFRNIVLGIMFVIVLATFIIAFIQAKRLW